MSNRAPTLFFKLTLAANQSCGPSPVSVSLGWLKQLIEKTMLALYVPTLDNGVFGLDSHTSYLSNFDQDLSGIITGK
jgi:hypothetical protein